MPFLVRTPAASLRVFLESIVDYAGLFPPASREMRESVANYDQHLAGPHGWALGRFIVPATRLQEFAEARAAVSGGQWQLSTIIGGDLAAELELVEQFNARWKNAAVDCVELRVSTVGEIDRACVLRPSGIAIFLEIAPERAAELLPFLRNSGAHAKLRTGGVVESAFPELERVTEFIASCAELGLAFKATAGLHHPLRCVRALTYEPKSPTGAMHGFLNLFTAAATAWSAVQAGRAIPREILATCMADSDSSDWHFGEDGLTWSGDEEPVHFDLGKLRNVRERFALSFGSCSFQEPIEELHEMKLL